MQDKRKVCSGSVQLRAIAIPIITSTAVSIVCKYGIQKYLPGRVVLEADAPMIVSAPFERPEAPIPATARPTINITED